jgi:predicted ArsR family transcriptional regulator
VKSADSLEARITRVAALDQPLRRELYAVLQTNDWLSRDAAAERLGIARSVAAFHLDKLVELGLAEVRFERTTGRSGPGAGRTAKLYRKADVELSAAVPDRRYDLAGSLLAAAVAEATETGAPVADCLATAARAAGRVIGAEAGLAAASRARRKDRVAAIVDVLGRHGYEPRVRGRSEIALTNCPFHRLAEEHRSLVCGMNLDFLTGLIDGLAGNDEVTARLAPEPGYCCVRIDT